MDWTTAIVLLGVAILCVILGYVIGLRDGRRISRQVWDKWLQ